MILNIKMDLESRSRSRSPGNRKDRYEEGSKFGNTSPSEKLYLTFLPEDVRNAIIKIDERTLRNVFEQVGVVTRVKITKKDDGFTFAFLDMESVDIAERAIQRFQRYKIGEKMIRVQFARPKPGSDQRGPNNRDNSREKGGFRGDFKK